MSMGTEPDTRRAAATGEITAPDAPSPPALDAALAEELRRTSDAALARRRVEDERRATAERDAWEAAQTVRVALVLDRLPGLARQAAANGERGVEVMPLQPNDFQGGCEERSCCTDRDHLRGAAAAIARHCDDAGLEVRVAISMKPQYAPPPDVSDPCIIALVTRGLWIRW